MNEIKVKVLGLCDDCKTWIKENMKLIEIEPDINRTVYPKYFCPVCGKLKNSEHSCFLIIKEEE